MTASIQPNEWLRFAEEEYLNGFIRDGGAAMKFAVPLDDSVRPELMTGLAGISSQAGYLLIRINAAETRIHMVDEIFFRTAEQVPWHSLSEKVIAKLASECGYSWAATTEGPLYVRLAEKNQVDPQMLLLDLKKAIGNKVFKQRSLSRDFRVAMTHLCIAELAGGPDGDTTITVLTDWLMGHNKAVSAVKPYQIYRKINRATARYFFESLIHWLRFAEYPGVVILLDTQRVMLPRNQTDPGFFYTKATLLDSYEVLRQFIDGADQLEGCFIVVVPHTDFLQDSKRGLAAYEALKFRVFDEIRDKSLVNPMASLVRISTTP
jgi:hypothetical protein